MFRKLIGARSRGHVKTLVLAALEEELSGQFNDVPGVIFTGVGKVNAAYRTVQAIIKHKPKRIINLGTAGSTYYPKKSLVYCGYFQDRDMDCSLLGYPKGVTPYEPCSLVYGSPTKAPDNSNPKTTCFTGDKFLSSLEMKKYYPGVVDMEAYAIAKIVFEYGLEFLCAKYITDGGGGNSASDWAKHLHEGALIFRDIYNKTERH